MKVELVKEMYSDDTLGYFVKVDGIYLNDSYSLTEEKARVKYHNYLEGKVKTEEVIKSIEI